MSFSVLKDDERFNKIPFKLRMLVTVIMFLLKILHKHLLPLGLVSRFTVTDSGLKKPAPRKRSEYEQ